MNLYGAQRTNYTPSVPRIVTQPGQQRRPEIRSMNRGKKDPTKDPVRDLLMSLSNMSQPTSASGFIPSADANQEFLLKLSQMQSGGIV